MKLSKISVDNITQFDLRPPELCQIVNKLEEYYYCFVISSKVKIGYFHIKTRISLSESFWVDVIQRQILVRKKCLPEIVIWCEKILEEQNFDIDNEDHSLSKIINLFYRVYKIVHIDNEHAGDIDDGFQNHMYNNLLHVDEKGHLTIALFFYCSNIQHVIYYLYNDSGGVFQKNHLPLYGSI